MIFAWPFADGVMIKPSPVEGGLLVGGLAAVVAGLWAGKSTHVLIGAATVGAVGWRCYEKAVEVTEPELMNGYFLTGGKLSATSGEPAQSGALRRILGLGGRTRRRVRPVDDSYGDDSE